MSPSLGQTLYSAPFGSALAPTGSARQTVDGSEFPIVPLKFSGGARIVSTAGIKNAQLHMELVPDWDRALPLTRSPFDLFLICGLVRSLVPLPQIGRVIKLRLCQLSIFPCVPLEAGCHLGEHFVRRNAT